MQKLKNYSETNKVKLKKRFEEEEERRVRKKGVKNYINFIVQED